MTRRLADFYIIGAMKCATSTLHEQLALRQRFFMTDPKEPNFFNDVDKVEREFSGYAGLFDGASEGQICGESSTHYTKIPTYQGTAERIFEHTPGARFVYVMRAPIERMASQYVHEWTQREVEGSFSEAVLQHERYVAYSSYARQLGPFVQLFGRERILPVFFEYLVAQPASELERVARFLGDDSEEPFQWHEAAGRTNVSKQRMRRSPFRDKVLSFRPVGVLKDALPSDLKERIKSLWRLEKRPELSLEAAAFARSKLDEDLAVLGSMLGLSLDCATFSRVARQAQPHLQEPQF